MSNLKDKIKEIINIEKKLIIAGMKYLNILNKYDKLIITDNKYYIAKNSIIFFVNKVNKYNTQYSELEIYQFRTCFINQILLNYTNTI